MFATKNNLLQAKKTLQISKVGYELLDKKRIILNREIADLAKKIKDIREKTQQALSDGYEALGLANFQLGTKKIVEQSKLVELDESLKISNKSTMGVEIPIIDFVKKPKTLYFDLAETNQELDIATEKFTDVKDLLILLAMFESASRRLKIASKKTNKRANALKNIVIPKYEKLAKEIESVLEERERDEFTRLKMVKKGS